VYVLFFYVILCVRFNGLIMNNRDIFTAEVKQRLRDGAFRRGGFSQNYIDRCLSSYSGCKKLFKIVDPLEYKCFFPQESKPDSVLKNEVIVDDVKTCVRKVRGKGKKLSMVRVDFKINPEQLVKLKQLGGNKSEHIRKAVDQYLIGIENSEKKNSCC